jgi:hypothetical protein
MGSIRAEDRVVIGWVLFEASPWAAFFPLPDCFPCEVGAVALTGDAEAACLRGHRLNPPATVPDLKPRGRFREIENDPECSVSPAHMHV